MNRITITSLILFLLLIASAPNFLPLVDAVEQENYMNKIEQSLLNRTDTSDPVDVIVEYNDNAGEFKARHAIQMVDSAAEVIQAYKSLNMLRVKMIPQDIVRLAKSDAIERIWSNELTDYSVHSNYTTTQQGDDLVSPYQSIRAQDLWDLGYNGSGVVIAILDTGVDFFHPDLDDFDDNNNTQDSKVTAFASFVEVDATPIDLMGHGTYVASIAAGTGNKSDGLYAGVAPGASIIAAKVTLGGLLAVPSWIVSGIEWASSHGADIILMPFNTLGAPNDAVSVAVKEAAEKGILIVTAAGDDGPDYLTIMSPGGSNAAFTVGAYDTAQEMVPAFSGRGPSLEMVTKPDIVAPGVNIVGAKAGAGFSEFSLGSFDVQDVGGQAGGMGDMSELIGGTFGEDVDDNYIVADSTAASAAIVAGAAALLMQAFDRATPIALANALRDTATPIEYDGNDAGAGLLNLRGAFDLLSAEQTPGRAHNRTTGTPLLALGLLPAAARDVTTTLMMSSYGTSTIVLDQRRDEDATTHLLLGMFAIRWNNMDPTNLLMFNVERELHQVSLASPPQSNYNRWVGVLSYDDEVYVTILVESYNLTLSAGPPIVGYKVTPFILNLGDKPIENVSLFLSYSMDLFLDGNADHGKYALENQELFAYSVSEDYRNFYFGLNSSRDLSAFEVGNSSDIFSHVSDDNLTGTTTFDGTVGLAMKWDFGVVRPYDPVNVTITMGMAENRTMLDTSIETLWTLGPSADYESQGDLIVIRANIPRVAIANTTYESHAIIMNIGTTNSTAVAGLVILQGRSADNGTIFSKYYSFDEIKPFNARVLTSEWKPVHNGIYTAAWAVASNFNYINTFLLQSTAGLASAALTLSDDFLLRDVFVVTPIRSISVFPKTIPFAPFDLKFPIDFGIYTFTIYSTVGLGNLTVDKYGNATEWGNVTLTPSNNVKGYYNFSLFVLVPAITMDGYHRCDYILHTEEGWTTNVTLEARIRYPRAMMLMDTTHSGLFANLEIANSTNISMSGNMGGGMGGGGFPLAESDHVTSQEETNIDQSSITEVMEQFRMTTFSGLSNMKKIMATRGLDLLEIPGIPLNDTVLSMFAALFIINPNKVFNATDLETLTNYTSHGGKLVIFGDDEDRSNHTILNGLLQHFGYYVEGSHSEENTTEIIQSNALGHGLSCVWLGGGTYVMNNQSLAGITVNGNPVAVLDDSPPELVIFGSSRIFMNKHLNECDNYGLLQNLNEYLLRNTLTATTALSENTTRYEAGKSVYINLFLKDYYGNPVNDLFVAIAFELPNGTFAYFIAGFVEKGQYTTQFTPDYWRGAGRINGIFIILDDEYANTFASIYFTLYVKETPSPTHGGTAILTMSQIAAISSISIFSVVLISQVVSRYRKKKRYRIPDLNEDLIREIDNMLNTLLAVVKQIDDMIQREDIDRIEKIEMLRGLIVGLHEAEKVFREVSEKIGGV